MLNKNVPPCTVVRNGKSSYRDKTKTFFFLYQTINMFICVVKLAILTKPMGIDLLLELHVLAHLKVAPWSLQLPQIVLRDPAPDACLFCQSICSLKKIQLKYIILIFTSFSFIRLVKVLRQSPKKCLVTSNPRETGQHCYAP